MNSARFASMSPATRAVPPILVIVCAVSPLGLNDGVVVAFAAVARNARHSPSVSEVIAGE